MDLPKLKTVTRTQGNNRALKEGRVKPKTFAFDFEEVQPLVKGFRRMVRGLEFDICEMALTTYVCAREHGVKFTALPIFLVRDFHHGAIQINRKAGIEAGKDIEGKKAGVNRGYTVTTGVWARSILQDEQGVNLDKVTWVLSGDEHVADYTPPPNVVPVGEGNDLEQMVISGEVPAAVGLGIDHPDVTPLYEEPLEAGLNAMHERGLYPINHLVVVRDDLLAERPGLARDIFETFAASKKLYMDDLKAGKIAEPTKVDRMHMRVMELIDDPLPYGIAPNRRVLDMLVEHAMRQKIITKRVDVPSLFAEETHDLVA